MSTLGLGKSVYVRKQTGSSDQLKVNFTRAYGPQHLQGDDSLTYQPSTGTLTATIFDGAITGSATKINVTDDTSTATTCYPTFVDDTGIEKTLKGSKTKLEYVPSSGTLSATTFSGPLTGNVTGNLTGNVTGNLTGNVTGDVTGNLTGDVTGNASSADKAAQLRVPLTGLRQGEILYETTSDPLNPLQQNTMGFFVNSKGSPDLIVKDNLITIQAVTAYPLLQLYYTGVPGTTDLRRMQIDNQSGGFRVGFIDDASTGGGANAIEITRNITAGVATDLNANEVKLRGNKLLFQNKDATADVLTVNSYTGGTTVTIKPTVSNYVCIDAVGTNITAGHSHYMRITNTPGAATWICGCDGVGGPGYSSGQGFLGMVNNAGFNFIINNTAIGYFNTTAAAYQFAAFGAGFFSNQLLVAGVVVGSDDRLKHNEQPITGALATLKKLKPQTYDKTIIEKDIDYNGHLEDGKYFKEAGFIAQEVLEDVPELDFIVNLPKGDKPEEKYYSINYIDLHAYEVSAIQELASLVESQALLIENLKDRVAILESNQAQ